MKTLGFKIMIFVALFGVKGNAGSIIVPCQENCVEEIALPVMEKAVLDQPQSIPQDVACPKTGYEIETNVANERGGLLSSANLVRSLLDKSSALQSHLESDGSRCGTCKQINLVSPFTTCRPEKIRTDRPCGTPSTSNIQKEMNNADIENFVGQTLQGKTPEGQKLYANCPSSCGFYVASATTPLNANQSRLNLTVACGQPRQDSILFATYLFTSGFIHQWSCVKP